MVNYDHLDRVVARHEVLLRASERERLARQAPLRPGRLPFAAVGGLVWLGQHLLAWACMLEQRLSPAIWGEAAQSPCASS